MKDLQNIELINNISALLENARKKVVVAVNQTIVLTYFEIGRMIVEDEQNGENRAEYGKKILKDLSIGLTERFGRGFSVDNLENMRNFYLSYNQFSISETSSRKLKIENSETPSRNSEKEISSTPLTILEIQQTPSAELEKSQKTFTLSWSHYLKLMRIKDLSERNFYEIDSIKNNWSLRELQHQY